MAINRRRNWGSSAQKIALRRAQEISARKRRGTGKLDVKKPKPTAKDYRKQGDKIGMTAPPRERRVVRRMIKFEKSNDPSLDVKKAPAKKAVKKAPAKKATSKDYNSMSRAEQSAQQARDVAGDKYIVRYPVTTRDIRTGKKTTKVVKKYLTVRPGTDPEKAAVASFGKRNFTITKPAAAKKPKTIADRRSPNTKAKMSQKELDSHRNDVANIYTRIHNTGRSAKIDVGNDGRIEIDFSNTDMAGNTLRPQRIANELARQGYGDVKLDGNKITARVGGKPTAPVNPFRKNDSSAPKPQTLSSTTSPDLPDPGTMSASAIVKERKELLAKKREGDLSKEEAARLVAIQAESSLRGKNRKEGKGAGPTKIGPGDNKKKLKGTWELVNGDPSKRDPNTTVTSLPKPEDMNDDSVIKDMPSDSRLKLFGMRDSMKEIASKDLERMNVIKELNAVKTVGDLVEAAQSIYWYLDEWDGMGRNTSALRSKMDKMFTELKKYSDRYRKGK